MTDSTVVQVQMDILGLMVGEDGLLLVQVNSDMFLQKYLEYNFLGNLN